MAVCGWGLPPPPCDQHWEFVCCEGEVAAVLLVLQGDKSPFMPAMLPWSAEQSHQNSMELVGDTAPGPKPARQHSPPPCAFKSWHEGCHTALTQSNH